MTITKDVQSVFLSWVGRGTLAVLTVFIYFIYVDVKQFAVGQQNIKTEQAVQRQIMSTTKEEMNLFKSETRENFKNINDKLDNCQPLLPIRNEQ